MSELIVIRHAASSPAGGNYRRVALLANRATLAKRRWRGVSEDGRAFGFDLDHPLGHDTLFHVEGDRCYHLAQEPEEVSEIPVADLEQAARIAWSLGNLHFGVQVLPRALRVADDPAVRQFLERDAIAHQRVNCVFLPLVAASHHHGHDHE